MVAVVVDLAIARMVHCSRRSGCHVPPTAFANARAPLQAELGSTTPCGAKRGGRVPWAELLRRVFAADVLACPCGGRRRVVAVVVDSALARTLLAALGLPCAPATFAPARAPPQAELWFDDAS